MCSNHLRWVDIKSDSFESKLIHLRIFQANREDFPRGWRKKGREGRREREREGGRKEEGILAFRHDVSRGFVPFAKEAVSPCHPLASNLSLHLHTSSHISLSKQWDAHAIVSLFNTESECFLKEFFLAIEGNCGRFCDVFSAKGENKF